jgi:hypothetical protein
MPIEKKKIAFENPASRLMTCVATQTRQSFRESVKPLREFLNYFEVQGQSLFGRD